MNCARDCPRLCSLAVIRFTSVRYKSFRVKRKWASTLKAKTDSQLALEHFDFFYKPIYKNSWPSMRLGLLSDPRYCALINNFSSETDEMIKRLEDKGAIELMSLVRDKKQEMEHATMAPKETRTITEQKTEDVQGQAESVQKQEDDADTSSKAGSEVSEAADLASRTEEGLFEFVPTQESKMSKQALSRLGPDHPSLSAREEPHEDHRLQSAPVNIEIVKDDPLIYPEHLKLMTFPRGDISFFPQSPVDGAGVAGWYLLDAASLLPVLALDIKEGDTVLDVCAAPGGKSLLALQTLLPKSVACNDVQLGRVSRLRRTLNSFIPEGTELRERVIIKRKDAAAPDWDEIDTYDKVLVDAPCTTDRHSVLSDDDSIFRRSRSTERLQLPEIQSQILLSVRVGGTVVYSTCSLSPLQNESVVEMAVMKATEKHGMKIIVKDLSPLVNDFVRTRMFKFYSRTKYGLLVLPHLPVNFGPMFVCKLQRLA